jgi:hypothetical protein
MPEHEDKGQDQFAVGKQLMIPAKVIRLRGDGLVEVQFGGTQTTFTRDQLASFAAKSAEAPKAPEKAPDAPKAGADRSADPRPAPDAPSEAPGEAVEAGEAAKGDPAASEETGRGTGDQGTQAAQAKAGQRGR